MSQPESWFSHPANAHETPKIALLIEQMGPEGPGIYWCLIEILRQQPGYKYQLALIPRLARIFNTTAAKIETVISGYDLFIIDEDHHFFSIDLDNWMQPLMKKREAAKKAAEIRWKQRKEKQEEELKKFSR